MENETLGKIRPSLYWNLFLKISYTVLRFGTFVAVVRILGPKDFGLMAIASMVIGYSNMITNFGLNQALVQKDEINKKHVTSVFTLDLFISICLTALVFFLAPLIAGFFHAPTSENVIKVFSSMFVLTTFSNLPNAFFRRNIDFKLISMVDFIKGCAASLITLVLAVVGFEVWALVWGQLIAIFGATVYLTYKSAWKPRIGYDHSSLKDLLGFGVWNFVRFQTRYFATHIDRFIVGRFLGAVKLGFYERAWSLVMFPINVVGTNVNAVLFSSFSRTQTSGKELKNLLKKSIVVISSINFPIYAGIVVLAPYLVPVILGDKWRPIISPLQILALSGFTISLSGLSASFNIAVGNYRSHTIRLFLASSCFALSCFLLVRFGLKGIALGVIGYSLLRFLLLFRLVFKRSVISLNEFVWCLAPSLLGSMSMLGLVNTCSLLYFREINLLSLSLLVLIGVLWYVGFMVFFPSSILAGIRSSFYRDLRSTLLKAD